MKIIDNSNRLTKTELDLINDIKYYSMKVGDLNFGISDINSKGTKIEIEEGLHIKKDYISLNLSQEEILKIEQKAAEIDEQIKNLLNKHRENLTVPLDEGLLSILSKEKDKYEEMLNINGQTIEQEIFPLGNYSPDQDKVNIYIDNIEKYVNLDKTVNRWSIVITTLVHELFHAFYEKFNHSRQNNISNTHPCITVIDEAIVEFSMLTYLDYINSLKQDIVFNQLLHIAVSSVKRKKLGCGSIPAYGFGEYIYEKCHNSKQSIPPIEWIEQYLYR